MPPASYSWFDAKKLRKYAQSLSNKLIILNIPRHMIYITLFLQCCVTDPVPF
jgi:hypothetical protein